MVTVCYNAEKYLTDCILSVNSQNYANIEHIVVDGGSKDKTLSIALKNAKNWTNIVSEKDNGIYDAMNKGIGRASGDLICFLNADDFYENENIIASIVAFFLEFDLDVLMTDVNIVSPDNPCRKLRVYEGRNMSLSKMNWGLMPPHPGIFLKKSVFSAVGNFDTSYQIAGDFELLYRIFSRPEVVTAYIPLSLPPKTDP